MKIVLLVDMYTDSFCLKFYEDPFIGYREIAETKPSMHIYNFKMYFYILGSSLQILTFWFKFSLFSEILTKFSENFT